MGTLVSDETTHKLVQSADADYPIMGIGTTEKDLDEAKYVMSLNACTTLDLEQWRMFECGYDKEEGVEEENKRSAISEEAIMSHGAERPKKGLELSMQDPSDGEGELCSAAEEKEQYNKWTRELVKLQKDPRVDRQRMKELDRGFDELIAKMYDTVLHDDKWGTRGGEENKIEWFGMSGDHGPVQKRKRGAY